MKSCSHNFPSFVTSKKQNIRQPTRSSLLGKASHGSHRSLWETWNYFTNVPQYQNPSRRSCRLLWAHPSIIPINSSTEFIYRMERWVTILDIFGYTDGSIWNWVTHPATMDTRETKTNRIHILIILQALVSYRRSTYIECVISFWRLLRKSDLWDCNRWVQRMSNDR